MALWIWLINSVIDINMLIAINLHFLFRLHKVNPHGVSIWRHSQVSLKFTLLQRVGIAFDPMLAVISIEKPGLYNRSTTLVIWWFVSTGSGSTFHITLLGLEVALDLPGSTSCPAHIKPLSVIWHSNNSPVICVDFTY